MSETHTPLESELVGLPEPAPPPALADAVMARIAHLDTERGPSEETRVAPDTPPERSRRRDRAPSRHRFPVGVPARGRLAAGLGAAGLGAYVHGVIRGAWSLNPLGTGIGEGIIAVAAVPASPPAALGLAAALLLILAALLMPLGTHDLQNPTSLRSTARGRR